MKKKTAKCVVVDPINKVVAEAWMTWDESKAWIGCDLMERVDLGGGAELWLDEEGWLKGPPEPWMLRSRLFAGRAVLVGAYHGGWENLRIPLDLIQGLVGWIPDRLKERAADLALGGVGGFYPITPESMREMKEHAEQRQAEILSLLEETEPCKVQDIARWK